ncbi:MAG: hypothetical protein Q7S03_00175 [bacterium]|nr:hypothetical protein [bacterium]
MMQNISPKIWIPAIVFLLIVVGLAIFFSWPREEKIPEIVIPQVTPREVITPPEGIVWNVSAGQVDPEMEKEIKKMVFEYFPHEPKVWEGGEQIVTSIENLEVEGEWAVVGYAARYKDTGDFIGAGPGTLVLRKINENWEEAGSKERLCQWFSLMPDTPFLNDLKGFYIYEGLCEE